MSDPRHFADAFNFMFGLRDFVRPEDLRELDSTEMAVLFANDKAGSIHKIRDALKGCIIRQDERCSYIILGIENQTDVHYAMPIKNLIYDSLNYGKQVEWHRREHRKRKDSRGSGEFLSGMTREDKIKPVITLTIYFGTEEWDAPRTLFEMFEPVDNTILQYVNDYKINLIVPQEIKDFSLFATDLKNLFQVLANAKDKYAMKELLHDESYANLSVETAQLIKKCANIDMKFDEGKEVVNMCQAFDELMEDERREGRKEGHREGRKEGTLDTLVSLVKDRLLNIDEAAKRAEMEISEFRKLV